MALKGIGNYETRDYISPSDPDKDNPTIFKIRTLDQSIKGWIMDQISTVERDTEKPKGKVKVHLRIHSGCLEMVRFGLKGFENFMDSETGKNIEFETTTKHIAGKDYEVVSDKIMARLPYNFIIELANVIWDENMLLEEEEKN